MAETTYALASDLGHPVGADVVRSIDVAVPEKLLKEGLAGMHDGFEARLELTDVTFRYPEAPSPAITSVTLEVPAGSSLAIVGSTGAGKSTLADVMLGLLEVESGDICLSGLPPRAANQRWPGAVSYVPQDVMLVNGSIRENVALGLPRTFFDDARVWEALERAQLAAFLRESRQGLDTLVGEHGVRLSGGQRQRLGLARGLLTDPRLLVLDEATSALDADTERAISEALHSMQGDVTLIVIAHRLATIRNLDQVAFLSGGHLEAVGTFDQVKSANPEFRRQAALLGL